MDHNGGLPIPWPQWLTRGEPMSYAGAEGISGAFRAALKAFVRFFWDIPHVKIRFCSHLQPSRDRTTCLRIQSAQKRQKVKNEMLVRSRGPRGPAIALVRERLPSAAETSPERPGWAPRPVPCGPGMALCSWVFFHSVALGEEMLLPAPWGVSAGANLPSQGKPAHSAPGPRGTTYRCPQNHPWGCCQEPSFPRTRSLWIQSACGREEVPGPQGQRPGRTEAPPRARGQCPIIGYRTRLFSDDAGVWTDGDGQHSVGVTRALGRLSHVPSLFLFLETLLLGSCSSSCWVDIHADAPGALSPPPTFDACKPTLGVLSAPQTRLSAPAASLPQTPTGQGHAGGCCRGEEGTGRTVHMPGPLSAQGDGPCFSDRPRGKRDSRRAGRSTLTPGA